MLDQPVQRAPLDLPGRKAFKVQPVPLEQLVNRESKALLDQWEQLVPKAFKASGAIRVLPVPRAFKAFKALKAL